MGMYTAFEYRIRIPYYRAKELVEMHSKLSDGHDGPTMNIRNVSDFFKAQALFFGAYQLSICPKNYDLVVVGSFNAVEYCGMLESYEDVAKVARNFQIVDNEYGDHPYYCNYRRMIMRNEGNEYRVYYFKDDGKPYLWGNTVDDNIDVSTLESNYCDEGEDDETLRSLSPQEREELLYQTKKLYGLLEDAEVSPKLEKVVCKSSKKLISIKIDLKEIREMAKRIAQQECRITLLKENEVVIGRIEEFLIREIKSVVSIFNEEKEEGEEKDEEDEEEEEEEEEEDKFYDLIKNNIDITDLISILLGGLDDEVCFETIECLFCKDCVRDTKRSVVSMIDTYIDSYIEMN